MTRTRAILFSSVAVGIAMWIAIYDLLGGAVVLGVLVFGVFALVVAGEEMHRYPSGGGSRDG